MIYKLGVRVENFKKSEFKKYLIIERHKAPSSNSWGSGGLVAYGEQLCKMFKSWPQKQPQLHF